MFMPAASNCDQMLCPATALYGHVATPSFVSWNSPATTRSMSGDTRISLSLITNTSCRAAANIRSRLKTLAFGYGGSPTTSNCAGTSGYARRSDSAIATAGSSRP